MATEMFDGNKPLKEQENDLNGVEQSLSAKTVKYEGQKGGTQNQATLEDVPFSDPLKPLYLVAVDVGASTASAISQYKTKGQALAFQCTAYVAGASKTVMGFR
jgi:hypothetical protein